MRGHVLRRSGRDATRLGARAGRRDVKWFGGGTQKRIAEFKAQRPIGRAFGAPGLNCLVLGGGGREYAIAWALARASSVANIDAAPGNGGMSLFTRTIDVALSDPSALQRYIAASHIDLCVVGPDELVAQGMGDVLRRTGIAVVAPSRDASRIEWSKTYAKELMAEAGVPTAPWTSYRDADGARAALAARDGPVVVKADGLAAGKGVVVARDRAQALEAVGSPGVGGGVILLEEVLEGEEASLQALVDGDTVVALPPAKDHKRVGEGDTGPNTGGMGAVSPAPALPDDEAQDLADALIAPVARELGRRGTPYRGVIFAGLIRTREGWRVLEYNARFGDPEAQVTLPRLEGDFGKLMLALGEGRLAAHVAEDPVRFSARAAVSVALCTEGYPALSRNGDPIEIAAEGMPEGVYLMHAGTRRAGSEFVTTGGRALHVVGTGDSVAEARARAYAGVERVSFDGKFYRSDIAMRVGE